MFSVKLTLIFFYWSWNMIILCHKRVTLFIIVYTKYKLPKYWIKTSFYVQTNFTNNFFADFLSTSVMSSWTRLNRPQTILFSYFLRAQIRHQRRYESDVPCVIHKTWRERKSQSAARQILEQTRDTFDNGIVCRSCVCTLYIIMRHTCILLVWYTYGRVCPFPRISRSFSGFVNNFALKLFIIELIRPLVTNFSNKKISV